MQPIDGPDEWPQTGIQPLLPPILTVMPRRPKKARNKKKGDTRKLKLGHLSREGMHMSCGNCGGEVHNKMSCPMDEETGKKVV